MPARPDLGPKPHLGYTQSRIERAAERRPDDAAIAALAAQPSAGAYVIGGDLIVMKKGAALNDPLFTLAEARALGAANETVFLGLLDDAARFGFGLAPAAAEALKTRDDFHVTDLRSIAVQGLVDAEHLPPIAEAKAVLHWHARHRFCPNCGDADASRASRLEARLPALQDRAFPAHRSGGDHAGERRRALPARPQPALRADDVVVPRRLRRAGRGDRGRGAARNARGSRHHLRAGEIFRSQPWPFPMSLMIGCHAEALTRDIVVDREELEDARWFSKTEIAAMLMRKHPEGLTTPPPVAIAHHIIRAWVEDEIGFD